MHTTMYSALGKNAQMAKGGIINRRECVIRFCVLLVNYYWGRESDHGFKNRTKKKTKNPQQLRGKQRGVRIPRLTWRLEIMPSKERFLRCSIYAVHQEEAWGATWVQHINTLMGSNVLLNLVEKGMRKIISWKLQPDKCKYKDRKV